MKKKSHSIFAVLALALVIAAAIVVFALIRKYTPSKEHEDLTTYYHLTNSDEVAIVLNNEVTSSKARVIDGHIYIDYDFVHDNLNSRFYWDNNENILLYATTQNLISAQAEQTSYMVTKSSADYGRKIVTINSDTAYIDLDFVKEYSDFKYKHVKDPHRIIITSQWGKYQTATAKKKCLPARKRRHQKPDSEKSFFQRGSHRDRTGRQLGQNNDRRRYYWIHAETYAFLRQRKNKKKRFHSGYLCTYKERLQYLYGLASGHKPVCK